MRAWSGIIVDELENRVDIWSIDSRSIVDFYEAGRTSRNPCMRMGLCRSEGLENAGCISDFSRNTFCVEILQCRRRRRRQIWTQPPNGWSLSWSSVLIWHDPGVSHGGRLKCVWDMLLQRSPGSMKYSRKSHVCNVWLVMHVHFLICHKGWMALRCGGF